MNGAMSRGNLPPSLLALGIVFGDIGTSPLYALRITVDAAGGATDPAAVLGAVSLIFWAIVLVVSGKYVAAILRTDNQGEGGVMALAALLDLHRSARGPARAALLFTAIAGAALLFGDGVITPAISVISAVEGIALRRPDLEAWAAPLALAVLFGLFASQRAGTSRIGALFGPVMLAWFVLLGLSGAASIVEAPAILRALDPRYAAGLAGRSPQTFLAVTGAAFLAVTGGEALYADLGQFGRRAISRAWRLVAMPGLLCNYFGQGALMLADPQAGASPFYLLFPPALTMPVVVMATLATVIASQAVITGVFSLARQAMELGLLPPLKVFHTSPLSEHHVYIPAINNLMGLASIVVAFSFSTSDNLASAYGVAVAGSMVTTTILFLAVRLRAARMGTGRIATVLVLGVPMLALDSVFVAGNATKFIEGAFVPLILAGSAMTVAYAWRAGRRRMMSGEQPDMAEFVRQFETSGFRRGRPGIFLVRPGQSTPQTLPVLADLANSRFSRVAIVTVWTASRPRVPENDRIRVTHFTDAVLRIDVRVGYLQRINLPALLGQALARNGIQADQATYVVGLERPVAPESWKRPIDLLLSLYTVLAKLAARGPDRFQLPRTRTLEVGVPRQL